MSNMWEFDQVSHMLLNNLWDCEDKVFPQSPSKNIALYFLIPLPVVIFGGLAIFYCIRKKREPKVDYTALPEHLDEI